jgi:hypothetical protein
MVCSDLARVVLLRLPFTVGLPPGQASIDRAIAFAPVGPDRRSNR